MMAETMANAPNFNEAPPAMATGANFFEGPPAMMTGANFYEGPQNMQYAYTGNTGNTSFGMQGFPGNYTYSPLVSTQFYWFLVVFFVLFCKTHPPTIEGKSQTTSIYTPFVLYRVCVFGSRHASVGHNRFTHK
jgi:hypothetical protein